MTDRVARSGEARGGREQALPVGTQAAQRAAAQWLDRDAPARDASAAEVVAHLVAVQAQEVAAATLGVCVRSGRLTAADVQRARNVERSIVRLWCLRGTLHLVAAEDVRWLLDLVRPRLVNAHRRRRAELGLDAAATARGVQLIADSLEREGPLTRAQLAERLRQHGIAAEGQATIHLLWRAALDGLVCYGPDREGAETFVLLERWLGPAGRMPAPADPVLALARRYLAAYGPASREDFASWSGLSGAEVRRAWVELGREAHASGELLALEEPAAGAPAVRLLPAFDALWLAYRDHRALLDPALTARVFPGGGLIRPLVFADNHIVGTWIRRTTRTGIDVVVDLFEPVAEAALQTAVAEFAAINACLARLVLHR